jgi:hypothetical protein
MAFTDLPSDWGDRPLTDPRLVADVLDLVVSERSRREGALCLLVCDATDRLRIPIVIDDMPVADLPSARVPVLVRLFDDVASVDDDLAVLVAIGRDGGLSVTPADRAWAQAVASAAAGRARVLGVHVVTLDGSRPVWDAAA